jgi:hypothetical protein
MSQNNLSEEIEKKLLYFFNNDIDPESLAKAIKQLNIIIALSKVIEDEAKYSQKENLKQGLHWLNKLAEILNPYLEYKKD